MKRLAALCLACLPTVVLSQDLVVSEATVPLAPPSAMAHAGYFALTNTGTKTRSLIGVQSDGYAMAHLHLSAESEGIATMTMVHQVDIAPGQTVHFAQGALHVMLMRPRAPLKHGASVEFTLEFANGEMLDVSAKVMKTQHDAHAHDS